jgi:hypothetical protein
MMQSCEAAALLHVSLCDYLLTYRLTTILGSAGMAVGGLSGQGRHPYQQAVLVPRYKAIEMSVSDQVAPNSSTNKPP